MRKKKVNKKRLDKTKKINWIKIFLTSLLAAGLSVLFGTLIGLISFDFSKLHLVVRGLIWISNVFVSYTVAFLISKLYKSKFKFLNPWALFLSYTLSVTLVIVFDEKFDLLYVTSYFSAVTIMGIILGIYKSYNANKKV